MPRIKYYLTKKNRNHTVTSTPSSNLLYGEYKPEVAHKDLVKRVTENVEFSEATVKSIISKYNYEIIRALIHEGSCEVQDMFNIYLEHYETGNKKRYVIDFNVEKQKNLGRKVYAALFNENMLDVS